MTIQLVQIFKSKWYNNSGDIRVAFVEIFRYIEENKVFFQYFLKNADLDIVFSTGEMQGFLSANLSVEDRLYLTFFIGGLNALLVYWLENGCAEKPEEIMETLPKNNLIFQS